MVVRFSISSFLSDGEAYLGGLLDDAVPHLVGQHHVLLYQMLLHRLVRLCSDHIAHRLVERMDLSAGRTQELDGTVHIYFLTTDASAVLRPAYRCNRCVTSFQQMQ